MNKPRFGIGSNVADFLLYGWSLFNGFWNNALESDGADDKVIARLVSRDMVMHCGRSIP